MKKVLTLVLAAFMMITMFAACGDETSPEQTADEAVKKAVEDYSNAAMGRTYVEGTGEEDGHYLVMDHIKEETDLYATYKDAIKDWEGDRRELLAAKIEDLEKLSDEDETEKLTEIKAAFVDKSEENQSKYLDDLVVAYYKCEDIKLNIAPVAEGKKEATSATATVTISRLDLERFEDIMSEIVKNWNKGNINIIELLQNPEFRITTKATVTLEKIEEEWLVTEDKAFAGDE